MVTLRNEYLEAVIEDMGAQLCSLKDLKKNRELIWEGNPAHWKYHAPVLFPFVGMVNGKQYRYKGTTYTIGQHGFARERAFCLAEKTETSAKYVLEADEKTREIYPFDFRFEVTQELVENRLLISWDVVNPSETEPLYFSVGAHPAFRVPLEETAKKSDCYVLFPGKERLSYILVDLEKVAANPDKVYNMELENGYLQLKDHLFDIDTFIFEDAQIEEASVCGPDRKPYVTLRCAGFPYFGLWTKSDAAPFVCLEPWYGRLDDRDFTGELPEKKGILHLEPGKSFHASYEIEVL
ncbi:MAG: aldose 1-epimerase family protein [Blautia sp.]|nr:aldose 1-epimerase family protein [Blautia sp.]